MSFLSGLFGRSKDKKEDAPTEDTYDDIYDGAYDDDECDFVLRFSDDDDDDIPEGCAACGGPYPACRSSCPLYDD